MSSVQIRPPLPITEKIQMCAQSDRRLVFRSRDDLYSKAGQVAEWSNAPPWKGGGRHRRPPGSNPGLPANKLNNVALEKARSCGCGGIGRHTGFRIERPKGFGSSTLPTRTISVVVTLVTPTKGLSHRDRAHQRIALVAQLDRAPVYEAGGCRFKFCPGHQF